MNIQPLPAAQWKVNVKLNATGGWCKCRIQCQWTNNNPKKSAFNQRLKISKDHPLEVILTGMSTALLLSMFDSYLTIEKTNLYDRNTWRTWECYGNILVWVTDRKQQEKLLRRLLDRIEQHQSQDKGTRVQDWYDRDTILLTHSAWRECRVQAKKRSEQ